MLKIDALSLGAYQTNCYIVHDSAASSCAIIDPGYDAAAVLAKTASIGLTVDAILLTHGHFDHVGAVEEIVAKTGCKLWMTEADWSQRISPMTAYFYPIANCDFTEVQFCEDGEVIHAGGLTFTVIATPGHTWGSVCYLCEDAMFCGDTLFAGACGRIDLPGGDRAAMVHSLERLTEMTTDYQVFPGHGGSSTLFREQQTNPYLGGCL